MPRGVAWFTVNRRMSAGGCSSWTHARVGHSGTRWEELGRGFLHCRLLSGSQPRDFPGCRAIIRLAMETPRRGGRSATAVGPFGLRVRVRTACRRAAGYPGRFRVRAAWLHAQGVGARMWLHQRLATPWAANRGLPSCRASSCRGAKTPRRAAPSGFNGANPDGAATGPGGACCWVARRTRTVGLDPRFYAIPILRWPPRGFTWPLAPRCPNLRLHECLRIAG